MKTIIAGNRDKIKKFKYFKCNICDWVGKAEEKEYQFDQQYNETYYFVTCPCCEHTAYSITDRDVLKIVLQEEQKVNENLCQ